MLWPKRLRRPLLLLTDLRQRALALLLELVSVLTEWQPLERPPAWVAWTRLQQLLLVQQQVRACQVQDLEA